MPAFVTAADTDCPECGEDVVRNGCACDGGDLHQCGVERYVEFAERGRERVKVPSPLLIRSLNS